MNSYIATKCTLLFADQLVYVKRSTAGECMEKV